MNAKDLLILAASATLAYWLLRWSRNDQGPLRGYLQHANSAPAGFVYDPVLDGWARTLPNGTKQIYV